MNSLWTVVGISSIVAIGGFTLVGAPQAKKAKPKPAAAKPQASYPTAKLLTHAKGSQIQPCWGPGGKIVYSSDEEGGNTLYVMDADGSNHKQVGAVNNIHDFQPDWGPDGKIAFVGQTGSNGIYIMDGDGGNRKALWEYSSDAIAPAVSKDGKIAFASDRANSNHDHDIWLIDEEGKGEVKLTTEGHNVNPSWSPDGKRIAFNSYRNGHNNIYVMDADGKNLTQLTKGKGPDYDPSWGPDGRIAFTSERDGEFSEIYIMNEDGTGQKRLTNNTLYDYRPSLGPGGKLVFQSRRDNGSGFEEKVYIMTVPK